MNANELADDWIEIADDNQIATMSVDELVNYLNGWYSTAAPRKAATMLRQQQARIKELQESEQNLINHLNESDIEIEALKEQVEGLKEDTDRVMDKSSW